MTDENQIYQIYKSVCQGIKVEWLHSDAYVDWYNYILGIKPEERIIYLTLLLDVQVYNGGFDQYFINRYGLFAKETIDALIKINALTKANLLKKALDIINSPNYNDKIFKRIIFNKEKEALSSFYKFDKSLMQKLDLLDLDYYKKGEDIDKCLEKYLSAYSK